MMNPLRLPRFCLKIAGIAGATLLVAVISDLAAQAATPGQVFSGLRKFYAATSRADGSFFPGIDPEYRGMSDSAYSDLAPVTYAVTIHKTFGWELPNTKQTIQFLLSRQRENGDFFNVAGTVDPKSAEGRAATWQTQYSGSRG